MKECEPLFDEFKTQKGQKIRQSILQQTLLKQRSIRQDREMEVITDSINGITRTKVNGVCQIMVGDEVGNHRKESSHARL